MSRDQWTKTPGTPVGGLATVRYERRSGLITEDAARELWQAMGGSSDYSPAYSEVLGRARALHVAYTTGAPMVTHHLARRGADRTACCGRPYEDIPEGDGMAAEIPHVTCPQFTSAG